MTGAGQGVGRQVALHLAASNAGGVVVNDYFLERANSVVSQIEGTGGKAIALRADVTRLEDVADLVERAGLRDIGLSRYLRPGAAIR
ncbi:SDR family NAD(P)-dependent oxidoreductase [Bradyrhizobium sp. AZCC 1693]|uniref:SDR family NAD(P)-dependent oxidoreductase n=1 Tax=Bradyrhizobium sp. AZCC 1693 TaxID=3117029 RepID=UPI003FA53F22